MNWRQRSSDSQGQLFFFLQRVNPIFQIPKPNRELRLRRFYLHNSFRSRSLILSAFSCIKTQVPCFRFLIYFSVWRAAFRVSGARGGTRRPAAWFMNGSIYGRGRINSPALNGEKSPHLHTQSSARRERRGSNNGLFGWLSICRTQKVRSFGLLRPVIASTWMQDYAKSDALQIAWQLFSTRLWLQTQITFTEQLANCYMNLHVP